MRLRFVVALFLTCILTAPLLADSVIIPAIKQNNTIDPNGKTVTIFNDDDRLVILRERAPGVYSQLGSVVGDDVTTAGGVGFTDVAVGYFNLENIKNGDFKIGSPVLAPVGDDIRQIGEGSKNVNLSVSNSVKAIIYANVTAVTGGLSLTNNTDSITWNLNGGRGSIALATFGGVAQIYENASAGFATTNDAIDAFNELSDGSLFATVKIDSATDYYFATPTHFEISASLDLDPSINLGVGLNDLATSNPNVGYTGPIGPSEFYGTGTFQNRFVGPNDDGDWNDFSIHSTGHFKVLFTPTPSAVGLGLFLFGGLVMNRRRRAECSV